MTKLNKSIAIDMIDRLSKNNEIAKVLNKSIKLDKTDLKAFIIEKQSCKYVSKESTKTGNIQHIMQGNSGQLTISGCSNDFVESQKLYDHLVDLESNKMEIIDSIQTLDNQKEQAFMEQIVERIFNGLEKQSQKFNELVSVKLGDTKKDLDNHHYQDIKDVFQDDFARITTKIIKAKK